MRIVALFLGLGMLISGGILGCDEQRTPISPAEREQIRRINQEFEKGVHQTIEGLDATPQDKQGMHQQTREFYQE